MDLVNLSATTNSCHQGIWWLSSYEFSAALGYTWAHWVEGTMGLRTTAAVFDHVKNIEGLIDPDDVVVKVAEVGSWEPDGAVKDDGRKKSLKVTISGMIIEDIDIEIFFVLEKIRKNKNLKDLAAEAWAKQLVNKADIGMLKIKTLREMVLGKFQDEDWMRRHWVHIQEDKRRSLAATVMEMEDLRRKLTELEVKRRRLEEALAE